MKRYSKLSFDGIRKRDYFFPDEKRPDVEMEIGDEMSLSLLDDMGKPVDLEFKVTRKAEFPLVGEKLIYGEVLYGERGYAQLEIRLKTNQRYSVELFPYAKVHV